MATKLDRGKPLEELVKGSLTHTLREIEQAFQSVFVQGDDADWSLWIVEVFADYLIVDQADLGIGEFYKVPYTKLSAGYTFPVREEWKVVELTYQPQTVQEHKVNKEKASRFVESSHGKMVLVEESTDTPNPDGPWPIRAVGITAGVINENGRRYRPEVLASAVNALNTHLHESAGQGRYLQLYGEAEHPNMKASRRPHLSEVVVNWTNASFDGKQVLLEGNLLGTSLGRDIRAAMLGGVIPGVSQRAYGESTLVEEDDQQIEEPTHLVITGYDLTVEPSDPVASITYFESQDNKENRTMPPKTENPQPIEESTQVATPAPEPQPEPLTLAKLKEKHPELVTALSTEITESNAAELEAQRREQQEREAENETLLQERDAEYRAALGLDEHADIQAELKKREAQRLELEEAQRQTEIAKVIDEAVAELPYPSDVKKTFAEAVKADEPKTREEAQALIERRQGEYDAILSRDRLAQMGMTGGNGNGKAQVEVVGPVIETVTGMPEFARASLELTESMVREGRFQKRDLFNKPRNVNETFAAQYLRMYDEQFKPQLVQEAALFSEAELTTDLNLPYSVLRTIVREAFPKLVATSIFDVGIMTSSPDKLYFETYAAETGHTVTITDEDVINVTHGSWFDLAHARVVIGSVTVEDNGTSTTYDEWDDYLIDYELGRIYFLSSGSVPEDAGGVDVTYQYDAMREGEMSAVQRAKQTLSSITIEAAADRLGIQVSDEAVVFAASQLGYDAQGRAISGLVEEIRRKIDADLIYKGLAAAHMVASNSGGTWTQSTDDVDEMAEKIGYAKVKVVNRYYDPTFALLSVTNGDYLSNSSHATAAGNRPDYVLNANGYVTRVKGLDCFQSTEMPDTKLLIGNRELVQHRVFKAMGIKGPYPSYADAGDGTNKLTDAEQYMAKEYNATATPVKEKGSIVDIA